MLAELLIWAGVTVSPSARTLGYAKAAVSLWSRRRRWAKSWREHEANSRAFTLEIAERCPRRQTLWLLGGGTLADIPLAELSAMFRRIVIFDIALLPTARHLARGFANVELRLADVTGIVEPLTEWQPRTPLPIPSAAALQDLDPVPPDAVVSLNLLSQLPLLPMEFARRHGVGRNAVEDFGRAILRAHLQALSSFPCPVGLIADAARIWRNRGGEMVMRESAVLDLALPAAEREWYWPVAPRGEIDPETGLEILVQAARLG